MKDEALKARLMAEAEHAIDELMEKKSAPDQITLGEMERLVIEMGREIQEEVLQALVEASENSNQGEPSCPECGQKMQRRGKRTKQVVSEAGEVCVERQYYYCEGCGRGSFPPR